MVRKETIKESVFFYHHNIEVDFYVPDEALAIQVSYAPHKTEENRQRESSAHIKLSKKRDCRRLLIISYEEEASVVVGDDVTEIMPAWKWLLKPGSLFQTVP